MPCSRLLLRESQVQPLLVVFEDLHWIDAETQAVLDRLVESLPTARLLLLVNYRPEYRHDWGGKTYYRQLRLDPLAPENATALLETLLGGDAGLEPLKRLLLARTEGNPFFLEESVRSLVDDGVLAGERGAYRLVKTPETVHVPATVQAILAARIDRLPAGGQGPPPDGLGRRHRRPGGRARGRRRSTRGRASRWPRPAPGGRVPLRDEPVPRRRVHLQARAHPRGGLREPPPGSAARPPRADRRGHRALYPERLAEHVERLAHHALRGEAWEKAVAYLRQAGAKAMARSAYREAAAGFEQALAALRHLPESRARTEQAIDLHLDASGALWRGRAGGEHRPCP